MADLIVEVVQIEAVKKHPNADRLDIATVFGYEVVCGKDEYYPGDCAVYFPLDSILTDELSQHIFAGGKMTPVHRIKAARIRGFVSSGLLVSIPKIKKFFFDREWQSKHKKFYWKIGSDLTEALCVTKHDPEKNKPAIMKGRQTSKKESHPLFRKYTKIQHLKKYHDCFDYGQQVIVTEKIHGTNFRAGWVPTVARSWIDRFRVDLSNWARSKRKANRWINNWMPMVWLDEKLSLPEYTFVYGSHNVQLKPKAQTYHTMEATGTTPTNVYEQCVIANDLVNKIPMNYVLYGEIYGPSIQKGYGYGLEEGKFEVRFFDAQNATTGQYIDFFAMQDMVTTLGLKLVPWEVCQYSGDALHSAMNVNRMRSHLDDTTDVEGMVVRSYNETSYMGGRAIMKWISDAYLLNKNMTEYK